MRYPFLNLATVNARYTKALHEAAIRVIDSGRYIGGEEVEALNRELADMCNAPFAIGVSNGLDALHLILEGYKALGVLTPGDEVVVPANTYIASILAITHSGLTPVLTDPELQTMNLSADGIRKVISPRTKAIMPVHLYGRIAWSEDMAALARDRHLLVIEDAAQAIGAKSAEPGLFGSHAAGGLGHAGAFSFYPTKNIGALGDAGAIITHDKELYETVKALANYGSDRRYHNVLAGFNCRLDPIQAAMLRVKLTDTTESAARRFERAVAYNNTIDTPAVVTPAVSHQITDNIWHQYVIRIPGHRQEMIDHLQTHGVETDIHYATPPHLQPCYRGLQHIPLPVTEMLADEVLSLPISDCTTVADAVAIARIINDFIPTAK